MTAQQGVETPVSRNTDGNSSSENTCLNSTITTQSAGIGKESIGVRADQEIYDAESFAVVLFYKQTESDYVEIAKVDDSEHDEGEVHFDRYYRTDGTERKDFGVEIDSVFEAEKLLRGNWRRYARLHAENHGKE